MLYYLEDLPPFVNSQRLSEDGVIKLLEYSLPDEWQRQMLVQGFKSGSKDLHDLIELCGSLETVEEIYQGKYNGERKHPYKTTKEIGSGNKLATLDSTG